MNVFDIIARIIGLDFYRLGYEAGIKDAINAVEKLRRKK